MGFVLVSGDDSRDDVGKDAASHKCHLVLQDKFALFQALQLQLVERLVLRQPLDHVVKVAMLAQISLIPIPLLILFLSKKFNVTEISKISVSICIGGMGFYWFIDRVIGIFL